MKRPEECLVIYESGDPSAPTILFLHGAGVSSWMWQEQIEALKEDYYCIAVDLPGCGESYQLEWQSLDDTASQLAQVIERQSGTGKAHVVGLSLGGYVAVTLLAEYPQVVETVMVSGITTRPFPKQWFYRSLMRVMGLAYRWDVTIKMMGRSMQLPEEVEPLYLRDSKRLSTRTLTAIYDEIFNYSLPSKLRTYHHWLVATAGDLEAGSIVEGLADFPGLMLNAVAALVPNAHHGWSGEYPDLFTETIRASIEVQPLPPALQLVASPSFPATLQSAQETL